MVLTLGELSVYEFSSNSSQTLSQLQRDRVMVIDFWHTKCVKCPAALQKLDHEAELLQSSTTVFVACALSLGEGNQDIVKDLIG